MTKDIKLIMIPHTLDVRTHASYDAALCHTGMWKTSYTSHEKWCSALWMHIWM